MMDDDSILPNDEMDKLRREIEMLKRKQGIIEAPSDNSELRSSMTLLSKSINSLLRIFKEASDEMKMDTHDAILVSQRLDKILDRLDKVEAQNEKIAKGIVAIADMVEELQSSAITKQNIAPLGRMQPSSPPPSAQPQMQQGMQQQGFEPRPLPTYNLPPDEDKKKQGFMNFKI